MTPARPLVVAVLALVAAVLSWLGLGLWDRRGGDPLPLPWTAVIGMVVLALVVVAAGLPVRRWARGRRDRPVDPLAAARTAVLAKAAAYGGAALVGWYAGQALVIVPNPVGARRARLIAAVASAVAAAGLSVAGLVVQRWCRVPPPDDDEDRSGSR